MFLEHFKLRTQPFVEHASASSLWQDSRMQEALARLDFLVDHGTLGLLTGTSGLGKSAVIKRFMHDLSPQHCEAVYCHLTHLPGSGLLRAVLSQLGETPRYGKQRLYQQLLDRTARSDSGLLLIFDEAHLLDGDALTDVRLLISSALDMGPSLKILLAGQDALRATLKRTLHTGLAVPQGGQPAALSYTPSPHQLSVIPRHLFREKHGQINWDLANPRARFTVTLSSIANGRWRVAINRCTLCVHRHKRALSWIGRRRKVRSSVCRSSASDRFLRYPQCVPDLEQSADRGFSHKS